MWNVRSIVYGAGLLLSLVAAGLVARPADAAPPPLNTLPVDRLVENLTAYIKEHPQDANGYFRLARAHAAAFVDRKQQMLVWGGFRGNGNISMGEFCGNGEVAKINTKGDLPAEKAETHLEPAITNFSEAIKLNPNNATNHLGAAYLMEIAAPVAHCSPLGAPAALPETDTTKWTAVLQRLDAPTEADRTAAAKELQAGGIAIASLLVAHLKDAAGTIRAGTQTLLTDLWLEQAIAEYRRAFECSIDKDAKSIPNFLYELVSYEAGKSYLRLVTKRGVREEEKKTVETFQAKLAAMEEAAKKAPPPVASPIVFSLDAAKPLRALVDSGKAVLFDLDGDTVPELRAWVKSDTAILVWDPLSEGKITSGRQLFGNVTWWIFWDNGYQALDALDDNRDGQLTGAELTGLGVWRDANQNGVSEPGEVVPVVNVGIDAISVRAPEVEDGCPANRQGLHMTSGETLPTYDWYAPGVGK